MGSEFCENQLKFYAHPMLLPQKHSGHIAHRYAFCRPRITNDQRNGQMLFIPESDGYTRRRALRAFRIAISPCCAATNRAGNL